MSDIKTFLHDGDHKLLGQKIPFLEAQVHRLFENQTRQTITGIENRNEIIDLKRKLDREIMHVWIGIVLLGSGVLLFHLEDWMLALNRLLP